MNKLLNIKEVSEILGLEISTIYDWVYRKKIAYVKVGRLLKFHPKTIEEFIRTCTVEGEN